jgi:hypothetical protein
METEGSLPYSQETTTGPYPEPDAISPHLPTHPFPKIYFNIIISASKQVSFRRLKK